MLRVSTLTAAALLFVSPLQGWAADGPIRIPKEGEGYEITRMESSRKAPSGYEGRTDYSTQTAVGNTPATMGKRIVSRFVLGNEIKICPKADGTTEGKGVFSMTVDYTDMQPTGTSTLHIEMRAEATYKGEVGDDAWIKNPVNAEIEYTYTVTGRIRDASGAMLTPAVNNAAQHLTIPFSVAKGMDVPKIGTFSGGDPTQGRYAEAVGAGNALVFWAGVFYSVAETRWRQDGTCVKVDFSPSSYSTKLVPGGRTTVDALIKTKSGEGTKGRFFDVTALSGGGSVSPGEGPSDAGAPMRFTFIAPTQKVPKAGFNVKATSRAGVASGEWLAGLGTDWSGTLSLVVVVADKGENEMQSWSNSSVTRIAVDLKNGKGKASGFTEVHSMGSRKVRAARNGSVSLIFDSGETTDGAYDDEVDATVDVTYPTPGNYAIRVGAPFMKEGKSHTQMCSRQRGCTDSEQQLLLGAVLSGVDGKVDDPNRLNGSKTDVKTGTGYKGTGTVTTTLTWNLSREGTTK
jgi:hypothetical protein